jgi:hypothetical protein
MLSQIDSAVHTSSQPPVLSLHHILLWSFMRTVPPFHGDPLQASCLGAQLPFFLFHAFYSQLQKKLRNY